MRTSKALLAPRDAIEQSRLWADLDQRQFVGQLAQHSPLVVSGWIDQAASVPGGTALLVGLRAGVTPLVADQAGATTAEQLAALDTNLQKALASVFATPHLQLRQIAKDASAALLGLLKRYESVHPIISDQDLQNRLDHDRRCFAFFHPDMGEVPLAFVEVALTQGIATNIEPILDEAAPLTDPLTADTAIFYSINSTQPGLTGIHLGKPLLQAAIGKLQQEMPHLTTFSTLSPVPSLRRTLSDRSDSHSDGNDDKVELPTVDLLKATARYLTDNTSGKVLDPVANFHLGNGAALVGINADANLRPYGIEQSYGILVNYQYLPDRLTERAQAYKAKEPVPISAAVQALLA